MKLAMILTCHRVGLGLGLGLGKSWCSVDVYLLVTSTSIFVRYTV